MAPQQRGLHAPAAAGQQQQASTTNRPLAAESHAGTKAEDRLSLPACLWVVAGGLSSDPTLLSPPSSSSSTRALLQRLLWAAY